MANLIATIFIVIIVVLHLWFCVLEMFFWTKPLGLKIFKMSHDVARQSAKLAANQGVYNAFLSAGLFWGLLSSDSAQSLQIKTFFLGCIIIAGIYGGWSVSRKILFIQGLPAAIALILLYC